MSKRSKYKISRDEAAVAILLRLNSDRWFTDWDVTELVGGTPHNHLNKLGQLRVVDVLRTDPEPTFRWSAKAAQNNPQYLARLDDAARKYNMKVVNTYDLFSDDGAEIRTVDEALVVNDDRRVIVIEEEAINVTVVEEEPEPVKEELPEEELAEDEDDIEFTPEQLRLMHEYEQKMGMIRRRGKTGRFVQNNLVWHPVYGSGVVKHQSGAKQITVQFPRPHGQLVVMDTDLIEDTEAIERAEQLTCIECGKKFIRTTPSGRPSLYCSRVCRNRRNARVRAEKTQRATERAAATAARNVEALHPPKPRSEPVAALTTEVSKQTPATQVAALIFREGDGPTIATELMSIEDAIELLMEHLS
jgi:hypothetical protein